MRILFIANSFGEDAAWHLYGILSQVSDRETVVGNLYIPCCTLDMHAKNVRDDAPAYRYDKFVSVDETVTPDTKLSAALSDEPWDIVCIQQASNKSGKPETYNEDIEVIINHVREHCPNANAKIYWHMTWAYDVGSTHGAFPVYDCSQSKMNACILDAVKQKILPNERILGVIPSGITIQNMREKGVEGLTRDGFHLSFGLGRYCAALTVAATFFDINGVTYVPKKYPEVEKYLPTVKQAVNEAMTFCAKELK